MHASRSDFGAEGGEEGGEADARVPDRDGELAVVVAVCCHGTLQRCRRRPSYTVPGRVES